MAGGEKNAKIYQYLEQCESGLKDPAVN